MKDYPRIPPFHPQKDYPEYPFKGNLSKKNLVYEGVRNCFQLMNLDRMNFGSASWNPLKNYVLPGANVVIKPNLVFHSFAPQDRKRVNCTITHGSVIRAILDYVIIALQGRGTVVIADIPIESADFNAIVQYTKIDNIVEFASKYSNININFHDLRICKAVRDKGDNTEFKEHMAGDPLGNIEIDLKEKSLHAEIDGPSTNFLTMADWTLDLSNPQDETIGKTNNYHNENTHKYNIAKTYLNADSIISIPKVKTHKKAGVTISLKNFIGLNSDKEYLPHHRSGCPPTGDAYPYLPNKIRVGIGGFLNKVKYIYVLRRFISNFIKPIVYFFSSPDAFFPIQHGSWSGNDTIWRTILDINYIIRFADKEGSINEKKQRKLFFLADGVVAGEGDGPLQNKAKKMGIIAASDSSVALDYVISKIMGFKPELIPHIKNAVENQFGEIGMNNNIRILSNIKEPVKLNFGFKPPFGWKDITY